MAQQLYLDTDYAVQQLYLSAFSQISHCIWFALHGPVSAFE